MYSSTLGLGTGKYVDTVDGSKFKFDRPLKVDGRPPQADKISRHTDFTLSAEMSTYWLGYKNITL